MMPSDRDGSLCVCGFVLGLDGEDATETLLAFEDDLEQFGPDEFLAVHEWIRSVGTAARPDQALAWLRWSNWDPIVFVQLIPALIETPPGSAIVREVRRAAHRVWGNHVPGMEEGDLAYEIGRLLYALDFVQDAEQMLKTSMEEIGEGPGTLHNLALCSL